MSQPVLPSLATEPAVQPDAQLAAKTKLHGRAFYESIGSPKHIIAPMVDQSEFAWRMLSRTFLPPSERRNILAYSPMLHARLFAESQRYRDTHFQAIRPCPPSTSSAENAPQPAPIPWLDGNPAIDRPLVVQFCANEPAHLLEAAKLVAPYCDAVDLNLGCPQGIARKGKYGAFLQEDQELIHRLIKTLHENLSVPVTAKIRVLGTREETLAYARNVLSAGASILTVHGRLREQKGHLTGLADWEHIRYLRENLPKETVLFANGNILRREDIDKCLRATGADGVMSAEGHLSDPALFGRVPEVGEEGREYWRGKDGRGGWRVDAVVRRYFDVLHRYVYEREPPVRRPLFVAGDDAAWLAEVKEEDDGQPARKKRKQEGGGVDRKKKEEMTAGSPNLVSVQGHLFHLLRHFVSKHHDVRDALARARAGDMDKLEKILDMVERKVAEGLLEYERTGESGVEETAAPVDEDDDYYDHDSSEKAVRICKRPWWVVQPIIRPVPKEAMAKGAIQPKREKGAPRNKQKKEAAVTAELTEKGDGKGDVARMGENGETPGESLGSKESLERKTSFPESELVSG
ncbi:dihydrouridine synthase [Coniochaeta ligniaria NRRL 30616]|uniref:tRNA-dihydrouridine(16/17) synthase [NAD(P)(+)] n=1 Tax=Coniochaeta ligniaria NRRL 30616 TaxID=1408157 RepID=A0A1J7J0D9_9PEZI|nr:dihydrouridine synthase [Coniochaeta ligniaria NRRL 30616]